MDLNEIIKKHNKALEATTADSNVQVTNNRPQSIKNQRLKFKKLTLIFSFAFLFITFLNLILVGKLSPTANNRNRGSYDYYLQNFSNRIVGNLNISLDRVKTWQE
jgi:hypothetical protein